MLVMKPQKSDKVKATLNCTNLNEALLKRVSFKLQLSNFIRRWSKEFNNFNVMMFYRNNGENIAFYSKVILMSELLNAPKKYRLSSNIYSITFSIKREDVGELELLKELIQECLTARADGLNQLSLLTFDEYAKMNNQQNNFSGLILNALLLGFIKKNDFDTSWLDKKEFKAWMSVVEF